MINTGAFTMQVLFLCTWFCFKVKKQYSSTVNHQTNDDLTNNPKFIVLRMVKRRRGKQCYSINQI